MSNGICMCYIFFLNVLIAKLNFTELANSIKWPWKVKG